MLKIFKILIIHNSYILYLRYEKSLFFFRYHTHLNSRQPHEVTCRLSKFSQTLLTSFKLRYLLSNFLEILSLWLPFKLPDSYFMKFSEFIQKVLWFSESFINIIYWSIDFISTNLSDDLLRWPQCLWYQIKLLKFSAIKAFFQIFLLMI